MTWPAGRLFLLSSALVLAVSGCGASDDSSTTTTSPQSAGGGSSEAGQGGDAQGGAGGDAAGGAAGNQAGGGVQGGAGGAKAGAGGAVSATPVPLRVADFNAENFFDDKADHPPMLGDETILTTADYQTKLAGVASILKTVNPDVILLQEIEGPEVLAALTSQPALASAGYTQRILLPGNDPRGINVAALSRIPFTKIVSHKDDKFTVAGDSSKTYKYSRDCLELHAQVNGRHVVFLGVHFKAKVDDDPQKRLAEGQHTRFLADTLRKADPGALVVILGDFNDYPTTPPINAILGATPAELFASVGSTLGAQLAWTVKSSGAPGGLALHDDQHTSPDLFAMIKPGSVTILHDTDLPKALQGVSDHAPVAATYLIK